MISDPCDPQLDVTEMEGDLGELRAIEQPLLSLKPIEMSPCKVLLSLPQETSLSERHTLQQMLETPFVLDEEFEIVMGGFESDIWEKVEATLLKLKAGETGTLELSLKPTALAVDEEMDSEPQEESVVEQKFCDKDIIVIVVTLLSFGYVPFVHQLSMEAKLSRASFYKDLGTKLFKANDIPRAFVKYCRAFRYLLLIINDSEEDEDIKTASIKVKCLCLLNMAACQMKYNGYDFVIENCSEVLIHDPMNVKALYRRGVAYSHKQELHLAVDDLTKALQLEPRNRAAEKVLGRVKAMLSKDENHLAKAMSKMFA